MHINEMTQELSISEFFELTFGPAPIELDLTSFVTEELTNELFFSIIKPSLGMLNPSGIFRNLFPYIFDTISRTVSLTRLVNCIQEFTEKYGGDDPSNVLQRLGDCTGRDFLIAFLDKIPEKSLRKILPMIVASNIPIPIFLPNDTIHSDKGLRILNGLYNVMTARKYHLFLSVNSPNHDLGVPFSKQLYKNFSNHREDFSGICNLGSIDISFHNASENHSRPPLAIAEVYFDETNSSTFCSVMKSLSQYAFYIVIHVSHNDFYDIEPGEKLITIINNIDLESYGYHRRRILIMFWGLNKADIKFSHRKKRMDDILSNKFINDDISYDYVINNKRSPTFEKIKKDSSQRLRDTPELYLQPTFFKSFDHAYNDMNKNQFAILIAQSEFNCRADIFQASHCSNMIEMLKDKTRLKTFEDHKDYRTENEINSEIVKFQDQQKNIVEQIPALSHFAQIIRKNSICEIREFAQQVDTYFKTHLYDLAQKDHVGIHRKEIKQKIEDRDITIHDFWREFIIMSKIKQWDDHLTILEAIYGLKVKELENGYRTWICESESIQILEGISLRTLDADFLSAVLSNIMSDNKRQLIVLSVIGLESSGKSTLLNYLFQCGFSTSAGRWHTIYSGKELDVLIIDSEGMGSTAQKYISRRTDFDKKMTLLALMCSQILIVNTKGLTRDISDILEVSSYHLDALSQRDSKPRINFVLRDMKDARSAQGPAFRDIRENLRKMFQEIPGCAFDMEDFMIVEEKDVHLLENAFSCSFDDFNPQSMITNNDNFHFPAETFPLKISNLREELLTSALIPSENHESQIFKNVHGFIAHMQSIWKEIDARGNFLHFKNSKDIQQWNAMKKLVSSYEETLLESYKVAGLKLIDERTELNQWTKNDDIMFEKCLDQETNKYLSQALADFRLKVSNQYNPKIIDEGITHINSAFFLEKRNLEARYTKRQRQSKESQLIKLAKDKIGEAVGKILEENKDKTPEDFEKIFSKSKRDELFDIEWKKIEEDHQTFMLTMIMKTKKLEEHVVQFFNQAIEDGTSKISDENKPREKFNRRFWNTLVKPATLVKSDPLDDLQFLECIKIKGQALLGKAKDVLEYTTGYQTSEKNKLKNIVGNVIKTEIKKTSKQICNELKDNNALAIEFSQALEWLKRLCDNIFIAIVNNYNKPQDNFTIEIDNFCFAEQYLRLQVFIILEENTTRWKQKQQENLKKLNDEMLTLFHNILSNSTYENISYQFYKYISQVVEEKLDAQGDIISEILERYVETKWIFDKNPTRVAYEKSFGSYDVSKCRQYVDSPTSFMRLLFEDDLEAFKDIKIDMLVEDVEKAIFTSWEELEKSIASWEQHFLSSQNITLRQILQRANGMAVEELVENASRLLGQCVIKSPVEFFVVLKDEHNKSLDTFAKHWKENGIFNCKESLRRQISSNKDYYWYKAEGCTHRCPLCGSKCELAKHDPGTHHVASFHLMVCFNGWRNSDTHIATLKICSEPAAHDTYWITCKEKEKEALILEKFMKKHYPDWWPLDQIDPANDQLMQVRAMWMHLKDELCKKWDMKDVTPENWLDAYYHLFK